MSDREPRGARTAWGTGIVALPGSFFGPGQDDHLRFAFANVRDEQMADVARRLALFAGSTSE